METKPHKGMIWEKVAEMNLPERELVDSFDSEEDFIRYMNRKPLIDWEQTKNQLGGGLRKIEIKISEGEAEESGLKPSGMTMDKLKARRSEAMDEEDEERSGSDKKTGKG